MLRSTAIATMLFALASCTEVSNASLQGRVIDGVPQGALPTTQAISPSVGSVSTQRLDTFARGYLNTAQALSFRDGIEYCGFFFVDAAGAIASTEPSPGEAGSCRIGNPPNGVVAGWHTHSAYDRDVIGEVPSPRDMAITFEIGLDGYVATPGGRLWRMNSRAQNAEQVCSAGCLLTDPAFVEDPRFTVRNSYTLPSLLQSVGASAAATPGRVIIER